MNKKNEKYWEDRIILKDKLLEKDIKKIEKKLLRAFKDARKEVLNELKILYSDIEHSEYAKYQLESIITSIDKSLDNLYKYNEQVVTEGLKDIYKEMDKQASIDLEASFNTINDRLIEEVIRTNWSGLSFSDRIWEHRRKLALTLKEELNRGLIRGDSLQDISRVIADKLNNSYSNAMRLVRTESCYVMNEATVNNYKENGIKEYEFMAFLDSKTSKVCRKLDGKKFSIEEYQAGVNLPPLHPNCRSCIIPVVE
jgi:SPP1 gp7 family putative phage head morphogenesis protein